MESDKARDDSDIKAELFEYYQQESKQVKRPGRSQQQTQVLSKDAVNKLSLNTMKAALILEMPGFKTSLLGQRNASGEPTSLDVEYTSLEANTVLVNFKYYLNSFKLTAQIDYILVRDQFNEQFTDQFRDIVSTSGEIQLVFNMQSDGALDLKVNCARQITANLVFSELYYLQNFFFVQQDSLANERLKKRERRYQLNGKYQDLFAHVQVLKKYLNEDPQETSAGQHTLEKQLVQALKKESQNIRTASQSDTIRTVFVA